MSVFGVAPAIVQWVHYLGLNASLTLNNNKWVCFFLKKVSSFIKNILFSAIEEAGNEVKNGIFFDTLLVKPKLGAEEIKKRAEEKQINLRYFDGGVGIALDETVSEQDLQDLFWVFGSESTVEQVCFLFK